MVAGLLLRRASKSPDPSIRREEKQSSVKEGLCTPSRDGKKRKIEREEDGLN